MSSCSKCTSLVELTNSGHVTFQAIPPMIDSIEETLIFHQVNYEKSSQLINWHYDCFQQLELIVEEVNRLFHTTAKIKMFCQWGHHSLHGKAVSTHYNFAQFRTIVHNREYLKIINNQLFTSYIQPIVSLKQPKIYGYEFLLRPKSNEKSFHPGELFQFSKEAGLQSLLDSQARISSIRMSAKHLTKGVKRFINFLPSSIYDSNHCLKSTFQAVEKYNVDPKDLVFEVVETEKITDIDHLSHIFNQYKKHGMKVALDDLGAGYSTVDVLKVLRPNFAKLDRSLIDHCDKDQSKQNIIQEIVSVAKEYTILLLAEGIERIEEVKYCKNIGIPLAQGYFFSPPKPEPVEEIVRAW